MRNAAVYVYDCAISRVSSKKNIVIYRAGLSGVFLKTRY